MLVCRRHRKRSLKPSRKKKRKRRKQKHLLPKVNKRKLANLQPEVKGARQLRRREEQLQQEAGLPLQNLLKRGWLQNRKKMSELRKRRRKLNGSMKRKRD